jgi:hypothetical protein
MLNFFSSQNKTSSFEEKSEVCKCCQNCKLKKNTSQKKLNKLETENQLYYSTNKEYERDIYELKLNITQNNKVMDLLVQENHKLLDEIKYLKNISLKDDKFHKKQEQSCSLEMNSLENVINPSLENEKIVFFLFLFKSYVILMLSFCLKMIGKTLNLSFLIQKFLWRIKTLF